MTLVTFFSRLDPITLTISIGFYGIYLGIYFSLFEAVGDLKNIRDRVTYRIATENVDMPLAEFLDKLLAESKVLLLEPKKRSRALTNALAAFGVVSILAIAHEPLSMLVTILPDKEKLLLAYVAAFATASWFVWYEVRYFREFRRLEKKYPQEAEGRSRRIGITVHT